MSLQVQRRDELDSMHAVLGSAYIGTVFASILYGFNTMQAFNYFQNSSADSKVLMSLLILLIVLDTLHLALIVDIVYTYTITSVIDSEVFVRPPWSIIAHIIVSSLSDAIVRSLYCWRIWMFSNRNRLMAASVLLSTVAELDASQLLVGVRFCANVLLYSIEIFIWPPSVLNMGVDDAELLIRSHHSVALCASVMADALIAAYMCYLLARSRTGFANIDSVIRVLMLYSINTGLLTSLAAVAALLLFVLYPGTDFHKFMFVGIFFVLPKLLLTSLLVSLNARASLKQSVQPSVLFSTMSALSVRSVLNRSSRVWRSQTTMPASAWPNSNPLTTATSAEPITIPVDQLMEEDPRASKLEPYNSVD
ncbi:uncharacterized protein FIBRA_04798 [Fibroporia radiculosa]|uniref:DUF6534 domain-containing protein n=1 Tax=Fibroporia radiculosa TaxID=599839 RepID=J4HWQ9_9APHY|nr:uncharacterized protein FIBRA_04798 [Fibroporia radiculosa]CCM02692.1 predicted protein [Fibroporia radiculosa]